MANPIGYHTAQGDQYGCPLCGKVCPTSREAAMHCQTEECKTLQVKGWAAPPVATPPSWRCLYCDEVFTDREKAKTHLEEEAGRTKAHLETLSEALPPVATPPSWRCFHCDEVFTVWADARLHFGGTEADKPACKLNEAEGGLLWALRLAQKELDRYRAEDTALHRALYGMGLHDMQKALASEEAGYAKGLRDATHPKAYLHALEEAILAVDKAGLPEGYCWGRDALENFNFGKKRAALAVKDLMEKYK